VGDIHEIRNKTKKVINEAAGKIIQKEDKPQINSWFDKKCQIILEDKDSVHQNDQQKYQAQCTRIQR
jgi:hypothetical protein